MTEDWPSWDDEQQRAVAPIAPSKRGRPPRIIAPLLPRGNSTDKEQDAGAKSEQEAR